MAALNKYTLLISDSTTGKVYKPDIRARKYAVTFGDQNMKPAPCAPLPNIGINGIRVTGRYLYYVNTFANTLTRVKVNLEKRLTVEDFHIITTKLSMTDDLDVINDVEVIAQGSNFSTIAGGVGAALGRTWKDRDIVCMSTNGGGLTSPVNRTFTEEVKAVAILIK
ncbi:hypothetical protein CC78DRAFT_545207 [Lojkania enalia]|uniref:Uncharacterized protein n=1 Tax=Lojkania enalia TaxID=147567 RepID=A0A9P4K7K5_9PLEO|nr:hypothetical protein CC78DRAFT_545207 [Didymosphaeria enalia]